MTDSTDSSLRPRLCKLCKWPDFNGYGFNLHAEKGKAGQFIGKVDEGSPAEACGMKESDRIVEVEGVNIGNENHQQVVSRIKAAGEKVSLLLVDSATDEHYKTIKEVISGDSDDVLVLSVTPREIVNEEEPPKDEPEPEPVQDAVTESEPQVNINSYMIEPEPVENTDSIQQNGTHEIVTSSDSIVYHPRLCHLIKRPDFQGYGFNLHAERDKSGQFIGQIDAGSPAEEAHLKEKDRIIEVNGANSEAESHQRVIEHIKSGGNETRLLVVDPECDQHYKEKGIKIHSGMPEVECYQSRTTTSQEIEIEAPQTTTVISSTTNDDIPGPETGVHETIITNHDNYETEPGRESELHVTETIVTNNDNYEPEAENIAVNDLDTIIKDGDEPVNVEQNGIQNVAVEPTPDPEPIKEEPAPTKPAEPINNNISSDPFSMSAAEMRAKLQSKKRNDPRIHKVDMSTKKQLFEKL